MSELIAVLDESAPGAGPGVYYLVAGLVIIESGVVRDRLIELTKHRQRPVHWSTEGPELRAKICELITQTGVVASVRWRSVGRKQQMSARADLLAELALWARDEGATRLIIESGDEATNGRDRKTLRETTRVNGELGFRYSHEPKSEPLLWLADAVAGACSEYLTGKSSIYYEQIKSQIDLKSA